MLERPLGGNLNDAIRVGDTVRRRAGPWTPAVHALLRYLADAGFEAPRPLGIDVDGREILAFMEGEAHSGTLEPVPAFVTADEHLVASAKLLRVYHDTVADFAPPPDAQWRLVAPTSPDVICHNDWSPWNALFRDRRLVAILDWDLAGPGSRTWDLANAAYFWGEPLNDLSQSALADKARRIELYLDAYGLEDRTYFWPTLELRLTFIADFVAAEARRGDPGMRRLAAWDVPRKMREDEVDYARRLRAVLPL
jgi:Phosphotransferase enzyme family